MGGIAGHAGIFSTLADSLSFAGAWGEPGRFLNATTLAAWTTAPHPLASSRALGWDTQGALDGYMGCGNFSSATYYHTGYTGTLICHDPKSAISTVLLTSRVYTDMEGNVVEIHALRQAFNNAVLQAAANA
jgi:CubicO group peptidase (beta-lactamase class C family)